MSESMRHDRREQKLREIARNIARETMKKSGYTKINKKRPELGNRSFFANHWREAAQHALKNPMGAVQE
jgi:hypothetical protein